MVQVVVPGLVLSGSSAMALSVVASLMVINSESVSVLVPSKGSSGVLPIVTVSVMVSLSPDVVTPTVCKDNPHW